VRKVLFSCHGLNVYSYPAMLYVGLVAGVFSGVWVAQKSGMNADRFAVAMLILLVPALVGARLYFVFTRWDVYRREPRRIWRRSEGGMAMYGGLILAVPLSFPLLRAMDLPFGAFWDAATFTMLLGMAFTRVGCLLNGCCGGRPTAAWFALDLPDDRGVWKRRYPTQLIEMTFALLLFAAAFALRGRAPFPGAIFCWAVVAYGAGRFFLERLREDATGGRDRAAMQVTSIVLLIAALAGLALVWVLWSGGN
jgi:phosphatidylglycerol---prolipoprotein diacylglyceryl transferase